MITLFLFAFLSVSSAVHAHAKPFILMLDPAGDANDTGRLIDDTFERSLTLSGAQLLKQELENSIPDLRVIVTRSAGQTREPLQNAHSANRLGVDLFICLHVVQEHTPRDTIGIYTFSWGDECAVHLNDTTFVCYDKAHLKNLDRTISWAHALEHTFNALSPGSCKTVFAIPCRPLLGITAPALCIEVGLTTKTSWPVQVKNIRVAVAELIRKYVCAI